MVVEPGSVVAVPLGPRLVAGVVWDADAEGRGRCEEAARHRACLRLPAAAGGMRRFVDWIARYTLSAPGMVARMVLRVSGRLRSGTADAGLAANRWPAGADDGGARSGAGDGAGGFGWTRSGLAHAAGVSLSVVDGLTKTGCFEEIELPPAPVVARPIPTYGNPPNCPGTRRPPRRRLPCRCARAVLMATLLEGVTGSGKTEVYFEAIAAALEMGKAGARPVAGNRADPELPRALSRPLRRAAGRMAFRPRAENARTGVAAGRRRAGACRRRCAFGAVPAFFRSRADRRR
jgi:primosomal protein N' (replication factor Y)